MPKTNFVLEQMGFSNDPDRDLPPPIWGWSTSGGRAGIPSGLGFTAIKNLW